jgi:cysteinyl-tRNA synthetase
MSKSLGNSLLVPEVLKKVRGIELRYYMVAAHYRSHVEFSFEALADAATAFRRIEKFLDDIDLFVETTALERPAAFDEAMADDLGTPAAIAVLFDTVRTGNVAMRNTDLEAMRDAAGAVRAMLSVLGLDPADPHWSQESSDSTDRLTSAVDTLVRGLLDQRQAARAAKDFTTADQIRDQIAAAGIEIEDTAAGPRWTLESSN